MVDRGIASWVKFTKLYWKTVRNVPVIKVKCNSIYDFSTHTFCLVKRFLVITPTFISTPSITKVKNYKDSKYIFRLIRPSSGVTQNWIYYIYSLISILCV